MADPNNPSSVDKGELLPVTPDEAIAAAARQALGEWLAWPDAGRDGPREVTNEQVKSWLSGLPNKLASLTNEAARHRISHSLPGDVGMREALEGLSLAADEINGDIDLQVNGDHSEEVDVNGEYYVTLSAAKVDALNKAICVAQRLLKKVPARPANPTVEKILTLAKRKYHFQPTIGAVLRSHMPTGTTGHDWDDKEAFSQAIAILDLIPDLAALTPSPCPGDGMREEAAEARRVEAIALNQNDEMRQQLSHVGNMISDLARAMGVDQADADGGWPDLAGRIQKLIDAALTPSALSGDPGEGKP